VFRKPFRLLKRLDIWINTAREKDQTPTEDPLPSCLDEEEGEPGLFLRNVGFS
jgi:hypothetical protein